MAYRQVTYSNQPANHYNNGMMGGGFKYMSGYPLSMNGGAWDDPPSEANPNSHAWDDAPPPNDYYNDAPQSGAPPRYEDPVSQKPRRKPPKIVNEPNYGKPAYERPAEPAAPKPKFYGILGKLAGLLKKDWGDKLKMAGYGKKKSKKSKTSKKKKSSK